MLTVKQIEVAQFGVSSDRLHDGNGLYLRLNKGGSKTFQVRLREGTATQWITLGRAKEVFELAKLLEHVEVNPADFNTQIAFGRVARDHQHQASLDWEPAPKMWQWLMTTETPEYLRQMVMALILSGKRTKEVKFVDWGI